MDTNDDAKISEIIAMAWDDETSFEAIERQFGLNEADVIKLMRREMKAVKFPHVAETRLRPRQKTCLAGS